MLIPPAAYKANHKYLHKSKQEPFSKSFSSMGQVA